MQVSNSNNPLAQLLQQLQQQVAPAFNTADSDGSGGISESEFDSFMQSSPTTGSASASVDTSQGTLTISSATMASLLQQQEQSQGSPDSVSALFNQMDTNHDGQLSQSEFNTGVATAVSNLMQTGSALSSAGATQGTQTADATSALGQTGHHGHHHHHGGGAVGASSDSSQPTNPLAALTGSDDSDSDSSTDPLAALMSAVTASYAQLNGTDSASAALSSLGANAVTA